MNNNNMEEKAAALVRLTEGILRQTDISPEVLQRMFDFASIGVKQVASTQREYHGRSFDNSCYFQVDLVQRPEFLARQLVVVTSSRDQGWSSYPQDQGTRNGSWTWVELGTNENDERIRLVTNIHAGREWERTESVFSQGDAILDRLTTNATINLYTRSCFPGWNCRMNEAEVRVLWTPNVRAIAERLQQQQQQQEGEEVEVNQNQAA